MSKIKSFKCEWEVKLFIESHAMKLVGSGSEGSCYVGKDRKIYKYLDFNTESSYPAEEIITQEEVDIPSFAFPEEVYTVGEKVRGYRTRFIPNDLFGEDRIFDIENMVDIDSASIVSAYEAMLEDIRLLSEESILIFDLPFNLMFDGEKFTAIDTCGYKKVGYNPIQDNIKSLNYAIESLFRMWFSRHKELKETIQGTNISDYIQRIMKYLPPDIGYQRIYNLMEKDVKQSKDKR